MKCDRTLSLLIVLHVRKCHFSFLKDDYFECIEVVTEIYFGFLFSYIKTVTLYGLTLFMKLGHSITLCHFSMIFMLESVTFHHIN